MGKMAVRQDKSRKSTNSSPHWHFNWGGDGEEEAMTCGKGGGGGSHDVW